MNGALSLEIRTPEGISFAVPLAGPVSRLLALTLDFLIVLAAEQLVGKVMSAFPKAAADVGEAFDILILFVFAALYPMLCEWFWRGQTVGKRLFHLRVIDATGLRLEPAQVIIRNLLRYVDGLPVCYLVGSITSLLNRRMQRLGDLAAGTVVVRSVELRQPDLDQLLGARFNSLLEQRHLAARLRQRVPPEIASIALEALMRRGQLEAGARVELFGDLARYFGKLVEYPAEVVEQMADEQYVRNVVEDPVPGEALARLQTALDDGVDRLQVVSAMPQIGGLAQFTPLFEDLAFDTGLAIAAEVEGRLRAGFPGHADEVELGAEDTFRLVAGDAVEFLFDIGVARAQRFGVVDDEAADEE